MRLNLVTNTNSAVISMELIVAQLISILSLGLGTVLIGLLPLCFMHHGRQQWPLLLSSLLCFGAGVLLSTSLVHILPEAKEAMSKYQEYSELIYCGGFFFLYILDELVHLFYETSHHSGNGHSHVTLNRRQSFGASLTYGSTERDPLVQQQFPYNPSFGKTRSMTNLLKDEPPSQLCHVGHQEPCRSGDIVNIGLIMALSTHALLEGLVVGLAKTPANVFLMLGAIASHKLVVGFCLGAELAANSCSNGCKNFISIFIFSLGSVAGIAIGMFISHIPMEATQIIIPILQCVAGGTLLYVTVSEVLPRERARWHQDHDHKLAGIFQFLSVLTGFTSMAFISLYLDDK